LLAIWNKVDEAGPPKKEWTEFFRKYGVPIAIVSARTGEGITSLINNLVESFSTRADSQPDFLISRTRHYEVLGKALEAVRAAIQKVEQGEHFPDLLSSDLRDALSSLGEITGEFNTE